MFYLVGLGLDLKSISLEAIEICRKSDKIYLENYTVEFPYNIEKLEEIIGKRVIPLTRLLIEEEKFLDEAKVINIVLLIYGSPLIATTHISLILKCKKEGIKYKIIENASIFDAVTETGLQIYKFGKTASMPKWSEKYKPKSFVSLIKMNQAIKAHSLILIDMGLTFPEALKQLGRACRNKIKFDKIIVCSQLGTKHVRMYYDSVKELLGAEVYSPFCIIIPSELHFLEKEALDLLTEKI